MTVEEYLSNYGGKEFAFPAIAGTYEGKQLVICADARCVWDDLEAFGCRVDVRRGSVGKNGWDFMTINKLVETFPGVIEHAYSNEPTLLSTFVPARRYEYKKEFHGPMHTHSCNRGAKWHWPWGGHGTSGLSACLTALALGYEKIVLCGMPLDDGPHNGEPHWRKCRFETSEVANQKNGGMPMHWKRGMDSFDGKITSMSGRTKEWLGSP